MARAIWNLGVSDFQLMIDSPVEVGFFILLMVLQMVITVSFMMLNIERVNGEIMLTQAALRESLGKLQNAFGEVKALEGILPICANCKKIRDDRGEWTQIEVYAMDRTYGDFSHSICPACPKKLYPDSFKEEQSM